METSRDVFVLRWRQSYECRVVGDSQWPVVWRVNAVVRLPDRKSTNPCRTSSWPSSLWSPIDAESFLN